MSDGDAFVKVASVGDPAAARIYAALLESTGIPTRLHGEALGPYVMTVGAWAVTDIWVPGATVDDAVEVLTAAEIDDTLVLADRGGAVADPGSLPMRLLALVMLVILVDAVVRTLMRVF
jgi:hypothetical protein